MEVKPRRYQKVGARHCPVGDELFHADRQTNKQTDIFDEDNNPCLKVLESNQKMTHSMQNLWLRVTVPAGNKFNTHSELSLKKRNSFPSPHSAKSAARLDTGQNRKKNLLWEKIKAKFSINQNAQQNKRKYYHRCSSELMSPVQHKKLNNICRASEHVGFKNLCNS